MTYLGMTISHTPDSRIPVLTPPAAVPNYQNMGAWGMPTPAGFGSQMLPHVPGFDFQDGMYGQQYWQTALPSEAGFGPQTLPHASQFDFQGGMYGQQYGQQYGQTALPSSAPHNVGSWAPSPAMQSRSRVARSTPNTGVENAVQAAQGPGLPVVAASSTQTQAEAVPLSNSSLKRKREEDDEDKNLEDGNIDANGNRIKRPCNAWVLYRRDHQAEVRRQIPGISNSGICKFGNLSTCYLCVYVCELMN